MGGYMIELKNFENCETSGYTYGGAAGSKLGIIIDGEKWFLKYRFYNLFLNVYKGLIK